MIGVLAMARKQWNDYGPTLTIDDVAEILMVDARTVRRQVDLGKIKATKVGQQWRFSKRHIMALVGDSDESESN